MIRQGRAGCECMPVLYPLAHACKQYLNHTEALREQLVLLEHALEKTHGSAAPASENLETAPITSDSSLSQLDPELYRVISSMPLDWSGEQGTTSAAALPALPDMGALAAVTAGEPAPAAHAVSAQVPGADASSAIAIDSDDDEPAATSAPARREGEALSNAQPTKKRKMDTTVPAQGQAADFMSTFLSNQLGGAEDPKKVPATAAGANQANQAVSSGAAAPGLDSLMSEQMPGMSDLNWLDFSTLGSQDGSDGGQFSSLFGGTSSSDLDGLSSLDFSTPLQSLDAEKKNG
ncbi:hypothetical protein MBRA1_000994 [Malassezia brasiliensis]|uniref:Uncharacterized protein n=1 Tax=Malassezia brasiliensis TaxID=1821822 RepID=A0AAF0IMT4_9BASI|nr:hypothetical protein MBRA1_000994 [Malassezia brasiliensis]